MLQRILSTSSSRSRRSENAGPTSPAAIPVGTIPTVPSLSGATAIGDNSNGHGASSGGPTAAHCDNSSGLRKAAVATSSGQASSSGGNSDSRRASMDTSCASSSISSLRSSARQVASSSSPPISATPSMSAPGPGVASTHRSGPYGVDAGASNSAPTSLFFSYPLCCGDAVSGRWGHTATAVGSSMVVYGGARGGPAPPPGAPLAVAAAATPTDELAILDVAAMRWRFERGTAPRAKDRPDKIHGHAAAALGTKLWLFGGLTNKAPCNRLHSLDLQTGCWARVAGEVMPSPRYGHAMASSPAAVYMFGGQGKTRAYNDMYRLAPVTGEFQEVTSAVGQPPLPRYGHTLTWDGGDHLVVFGGYSASNSSSNVPGAGCGPFLYSLPNNTWSAPVVEGVPPTPHTHHSATSLGSGKILVFGGYSMSSSNVHHAASITPILCSDAYVLDTSNYPMNPPRWTRLAPLNPPPSPRAQHSTALVEGRLVLYGGSGPKQACEGIVLAQTRFNPDVADIAAELFKLAGPAAAPAAAAAMAAANPAPSQSAERIVRIASAASMTNQRQQPAAAAVAKLAMTTALVPAGIAGAAVGPQIAAPPSIKSGAEPQLQQQSSAAWQASPLALMPQVEHTSPQPSILEAVRADSSSKEASSALPAATEQLEQMKLQLTDLLVKRNMEEMQQRARKHAEEVEAALTAEQLSTTALRSELAQARLLCEEATSSSETWRRRANEAEARAARDGAAADALRSSAEALRRTLLAKEEELAEAVAVGEDLIRQLGVVSSRYSRLQAATTGQARRGGASMSSSGLSTTVRNSADGQAPGLRTASATAACIGRPLPLQGPAAGIGSATASLTTPRDIHAGHRQREEQRYHPESGSAPSSARGLETSLQHPVFSSALNSSASLLERRPPQRQTCEAGRGASPAGLAGNTQPCSPVDARSNALTGGISASLSAVTNQSCTGQQPALTSSDISTINPISWQRHQLQMFRCLHSSAASSPEGAEAGGLASSLPTTATNIGTGIFASTDSYDQSQDAHMPMLPHQHNQSRLLRQHRRATSVDGCATLPFSESYDGFDRARPPRSDVDLGDACSESGHSLARSASFLTACDELGDERSGMMGGVSAREPSFMRSSSNNSSLMLPMPLSAGGAGPAQQRRHSRHRHASADLAAEARGQAAALTQEATPYSGRHPPHSPALLAQLSPTQSAMHVGPPISSMAQTDLTGMSIASAEELALALGRLAAVESRLSAMQADDAALNALSLGALRELEVRLEVSTRRVREVALHRAIADEVLRATSGTAGGDGGSSTGAATAEAGVCGVCMEALKAIAFGCGHQACTRCSDQIGDACPFCRLPISARIRLFDA